MKNKLILATLIMSFVLTITAFAAGWTNEENGWRYYDKDGCEVTCEWKRSGDDWYYLDSDGYMATDALIENEDKTFSFVDETGARVANMWVCRTDEDLDLDMNWIYIKANGRSVYSGSYAVGGKKYQFAENKMLYGYLTSAYAPTEDWTDATYYYGGADEGWAYTGWIKEFDARDNECWLYISNGTITKNKVKTIDGVKYQFDELGVMFAGTTATVSDAHKYYDASGALVKNSWIEVIDEQTGDSTWKYAKPSGALVENGEYKINEKWYLFKDTVMQTGWSGNKYYLSSGARAEGKVVISEKTYFFLKGGEKVTGIYKNYYYGTDGALVTSEDEQYHIVGTMLLKNDGKVMTTKKKYHDTWTEKYYIIDATGVHECDKDGKYN